MSHCLSSHSFHRLRTGSSSRNSSVTASRCRRVRSAAGIFTSGVEAARVISAINARTSSKLAPTDRAPTPGEEELLVVELRPKVLDLARQLRRPQVRQILSVVQPEAVGDVVRGQVGGQEVLACCLHPCPRVLLIDGRVARPCRQDVAQPDAQQRRYRADSPMPSSSRQLRMAPLARGRSSTLTACSSGASDGGVCHRRRPAAHAPAPYASWLGIAL